MSDINKLFQSKECKDILKKIASKYDYRMCLNKNVIDIYKQFFANCIMLNFLFDIDSSMLYDIYLDVETFTLNQCNNVLNLNNKKNALKIIESFFNNALGNILYVFHGTTSLQEDNLKNYFSCVNLVKPYVSIINNIYEKHNVYLAFQSGLKDYKNNNFWATTSISSATFYAMQSPEFFARFASRSDFYKCDIFKYDRIAYYRKDYFSCKNNLIKEMKDFGFNKEEVNIVLKNFKKIWQIIVTPKMQNIILFSKKITNNMQKYEKSLSPYKNLLKYFTKLHFVYDLKDFNKSSNKIILPRVTNYLTKQHPKQDKKFIILGEKKVFPDFYSDHKYLNEQYYIFDNLDNIINISSFTEIDNKQKQINIVNFCKPNSIKAACYNNKDLPSIDEVIEFYKNKFFNSLKQLKSKTKQQEKLEIIRYIAEDVGIKFIASAKYHKYFKDIGQYEIYQLRKFLGIKLFEHYDGSVVVNDKKILSLQKLYENILKNPQKILAEDIPYKIFNNEIDIVK